jgi:hypothetical protein
MALALMNFGWMEGQEAGLNSPLPQIADEGRKPLRRHPRARPEDLPVPDMIDVVRSSGQARG